MKKDENLERAFDEYFDGMEIPEGLAEDAKKLNKRPLWTRLNKYASAFACAVVVCIVAGVGIYSGINYGASDPYGAAPGDDLDNSGNASTDDGTSDYSSSSSVGYNTYSLSDLTESQLDPYSLEDTDSALAYIQNFAYATNSQVESCTGYSSESQLMLVKAEVTVSAEYNQQAVIYVEFTEDGYICEELYDYYGGESLAYGNTTYLYYETEDNGEPVRCVTVNLDGVKYYIRVTSTDENAYLNYLYLLLGN